MPMYIPVTGTLTRISWPEGSRASMGCTMTLTLQTGDQGIVNFTLPSSAYVLNARQFAVGDRITCFYENNVADRKSTRLNSSHSAKSRMPSSA